MSMFILSFAPSRLNTGIVLCAMYFKRLWKLDVSDLDISGISVGRDT